MIRDVGARPADCHAAEERRHRASRRHPGIEQQSIEKQERPGKNEPRDLALDVQSFPYDRAGIAIVTCGPERPGEAIVHVGAEVIDVGPPPGWRILQSKPAEPFGARRLWVAVVAVGCRPIRRRRVQSADHREPGVLQPFHLEDDRVAPSGAVLVVQNFDRGMAKVNFDRIRAPHHDAPDDQAVSDRDP